MMFDENGIGLRNPLFFIGVVENIIDERKEGRVQVRAFNVHGTKDDIDTPYLPWAIVCHGDYDPNKRLAINDWVFGVFLDGREAQQPMVLGLIPTQFTRAPDPENDGYGSIPTNNCELQMGRNAAVNAGMPANSRLHRAEDINDTYVPEQEMMRIEDIEGAQGAETWSEPSPAYNAEYPYNKVIETAKHSIEIDDTPGAERIMIRHNSGSFIQIDDRGSKVDKTTADKYEVNDRNQYVYVGGCSNVTIEGNAYVKVNGNKTEEINGNLIQLVHGNHLLSVGGESSINASELVNIRAADVRMQANAGEMHIHAAKNMRVESGETMAINSDIIWQYATDSYDLISDAIKMDGLTSFDVLTKNMQLQGTEKANFYSDKIVKIKSDGTVHIKDGGGSNNGVFIDEYVSMANGGAQTADTAAQAEVDVGAQVPDLAPPVEKRTSVVSKCAPAVAQEGILAPDEEESS